MEKFLTYSSLYGFYDPLSGQTKIMNYIILQRFSSDKVERIDYLQSLLPMK